jgi:hemoglobin
MNDIENRDDVIQMVNSFYVLVRDNERLGFMFDETAQVDWQKHLPNMYDFWESILFDKAVFSGNPMAKHMKLHLTEKFKSEDFDIWLKLFTKNLDAQFSGPTVIRAKQRAESIATITKMKTVFS